MLLGCAGCKPLLLTPHRVVAWQDEDRLKRARNVVPSWSELNRQLARSEEEFQLFERMDAELEVRVC